MGTGDHNAWGNLCDGLASHPEGSSNIPSRFVLQKPELSTGLMGHLNRVRTYLLLTMYVATVNPDDLPLLIMSFILMVCILDHVVTLQGEIRA